MTTWLLLFCITLFVVIVFHGLRQAKAEREAPALLDIMTRARPPTTAQLITNDTMTIRDSVTTQLHPSAVPPSAKRSAKPKRSSKPTSKTHPHCLNNVTAAIAIDTLQLSDPTIYRIMFDNTPLGWPTLKHLLLSAGARYDAKSEAYHVIADGALLFSVTNAVTPGALPHPAVNLAGAEETAHNIKALMLLLADSEPVQQLEGFDALTDFAISLNQKGGSLHDSQYYSMSEQTLAHDRVLLVEKLRRRLLHTRDTSPTKS